ncbi:MAG: penicillin acylase family protein [Turneriella sp.]
MLCRTTFSVAQTARSGIIFRLQERDPADDFCRGARRAICEKDLGSNRADWGKWGSLHEILLEAQGTRGGVLRRYLNREAHRGRRRLPHSTDGQSVGRRPRRVWLIPAMRFIVDFSADSEPAQLIVHMGVSGNPESSHYDVLIPLFTGVKNHPLPLKQANVEKQYTKKFVLKKQ